MPLTIRHGLPVLSHCLQNGVVLTVRADECVESGLISGRVVREIHGFHVEVPHVRSAGRSCLLCLQCARKTRRLLSDDERIYLLRWVYFLVPEVVILHERVGLKRITVSWSRSPPL